MPGSTGKKRLSFTELRDRARQKIAKFKTATNTEADAAVDAVAELLRDVYKLRNGTPSGQGAAPESEAIATLRRENEELEGEIDRLGALAPKDGEVVLKGDDLKAWQAFTALKLKPDEISARLDAGAKAVERVTEIDRLAALEAMAKPIGSSAKLLADFLKARGLVAEMRPATVKKLDAQGRETSETEVKDMPHVRLASETAATPLLITEYVAKHAPEWKVPLAAKVEGDGQGAGGNNGNSGGVRFPAQPGGGAPPAPGTYAESYMQHAYATPSEIRKRNAQSNGQGA